MFQVAIAVGHPDGGDLSPVNPIVDTGAAHSMLPASLLAGLHLAPLEHPEFILADGSAATYGFGIARFKIDRRERPCPVIFGPEGNYLLGASALAIFNLLVDPHRKELLTARRIPLGWGGAII